MLLKFNQLKTDIHSKLQKVGENYIELELNVPQAAFFVHDPVVCWESVHTGPQEALAKYFGICEPIVKHRQY